VSIDYVLWIITFSERYVFELRLLSTTANYNVDAPK